MVLVSKKDLSRGIRGDPTLKKRRKRFQKKLNNSGVKEELVGTFYSEKDNVHIIGMGVLRGLKNWSCLQGEQNQGLVKHVVLLERFVLTTTTLLENFVGGFVRTVTGHSDIQRTISNDLRNLLFI